MAVAAARDCLAGVDRASIGGLYFASTTAPYKEKQSAALIAAVLGLSPETTTMDFSGSLRSGTNALKAALDAVMSGSAKNVLVCAADTRLGLSGRACRDEPRRRRRGSARQRQTTRSPRSSTSTARYHEIQDVWRSDKDTFVRSAEERFAMDEGYVTGDDESALRSTLEEAPPGRRRTSPRSRSTLPTRVSSRP